MRIGPCGADKAVETKAIVGRGAAGEKRADVRRLTRHDREELCEISVAVQPQIALRQHPAAYRRVTFQEHPFSLGSTSVYSEDKRLFTWHIATLTKHRTQSMSIPTGDRQHET